MIKLHDRLQQMDTGKRILIVVFLVFMALASPVYGGLVVFLVYILEKNIKRLHITLGLVVVPTIAVLICYNIQEAVLLEIEEFLSLTGFLFAIFPLRIAAIGISGLLYLYGAKLMGSTMEDMQLEEAKKKRKALLKDGTFDFDYNGHMLTVGATGSSKSTFFKFIVRYGFENGLFMCILSAKLARTDKYSLLEYVARMAEAYNRKLYVVTMDKRLLNKLKTWNKHIKVLYAYNPIPSCEWSELDNILANLITFSEPFYEDNFVMWICDIYDVILASGDTSKLSFNNILKLYSLKNYKQYVNQLFSDGIITKEQHDKFLDEDVLEHEEIARKSKARLQRIFRNRKTTFALKNKISITKARAENAIIYFDMNGGSAKNTTKALGAMACGELQHVFSTEPEKTQDERKLILMDEISYYINEMTLPMFNLSRSAGYQCYMATQSFSDLSSSWLDSNFQNQMLASANQIGIMRQNTPDDAELAAKIADVADVIELTKRVHGIDYDSTGSQKAVEQFIARPTLIKNLKSGEMVYISKEDREGNIYHEASTCLLHWDYKDLDIPVLEDIEEIEDTEATDR